MKINRNDDNDENTINKQVSHTVLEPTNPLIIAGLVVVGVGILWMFKKAKA